MIADKYPIFLRIFLFFLAYLNSSLFDKQKIDYSILDNSIYYGLFAGVFFYSLCEMYGLTFPAIGLEGLSPAYDEKSTTFQVC
ncbi:hypothetical protein [Brasilonema bromeliae]|uniref:hypothetical protein n=1 Tax=Brasilonema bromeliae TaxID=383615 RepID=UPI00145EB250|nr:hypothetical protein [Brasilonema bromeliae]